MNCKIAVFLGKNLYAHHMTSFDASLIEQRLNIKIDFFEYKDLTELKTVFLSVETIYDGFITDSIIPYRIITLVKTDSEKPCDHMVISYERIYQTMLLQSLSSSKFDLSRIGMDYLLFGKSLKDAFLDNTLKEEVNKYSALVMSSNEEELNELSARKFEMHRNDCYSGKKDFFFTRSEKCVDFFEEHNIPYCFIVPNEQDLNSIITLMLRNIEIKKMMDDYSAVIRFMNRNGRALSKKQIETITLAIGELNKKQFTNFFIRKSTDSIRIETNLLTLRQFTQNLTTCPFLTIFNDDILQELVIGYGSGPNLYTSQINSIESCIYACSDSLMNRCSYFTGADSQLLQLHASVCEDDKKSPIDMAMVKAFARQAKLSSSSIIKIIRCMQQRNTNRLTSSMLEQELGISTRTANKYLLNLNSCGLSQVIDTENNGGKGRPINVHEVSIPYK